MAASAPQDHRAGHRARLRKRLLEGGPDALQDYELLELVLCAALPRRDVKEIAKNLIGAFGGFAEVIAAEPARLKEIKGVGDTAAAALKAVEAAMHLALRERVVDQDVIGSWQALLDYCKGRMQDEKIEQFRVLYLDRKNVVIADEKQQTGTVDHAPVYPRKVVHRALDLGASALILVHNHPSGDPTPSSQDIETTRKIVEAARALGIAVHDHIIVGRRGHASFKALHLI